MLNGATRLHLQLEEELADLYGTEATVLTSSRVNADVALLSTVRTPHPAPRTARPTVSGRMRA